MHTSPKLSPREPVYRQTGSISVHQRSETLPPSPARSGPLPHPEINARKFRKLSPRAEHRLRQIEKINLSPTLAEKFPTLKSLSVTVDYFDSTGNTRTGNLKYKVNVAHGKSLLYFNCVCVDCVGGDYNLTGPLSEAIHATRNTVEGEARCAGIRQSKERKIDKPCQSILRYKLSLGY